jgi:hypothetical protein
VAKVCCRRVFDVPAGDMPTVIEKLAELSDRERRTTTGLIARGSVIDYTAAIEVFDVADTGRSMVSWTATFPVPHDQPQIVEEAQNAVFRDFVDELSRQLFPVVAVGPR